MSDRERSRICPAGGWPYGKTPAYLRGISFDDLLGDISDGEITPSDEETTFRRRPPDRRRSRSPDRYRSRRPNRYDRNRRLIESDRSSSSTRSTSVHRHRRHSGGGDGDLRRKRPRASDESSSTSRDFFGREVRSRSRSADSERKSKRRKAPRRRSRERERPSNSSSRLWNRYPETSPTSGYRRRPRASPEDGQIEQTPKKPPKSTHISTVSMESSTDGSSPMSRHEARRFRAILGTPKSSPISSFRTSSRASSSDLMESKSRSRHGSARSSPITPNYYKTRTPQSGKTPTNTPPTGKTPTNTPPTGKTPTNTPPTGKTPTNTSPAGKTPTNTPPRPVKSVGWGMGLMARKKKDKAESTNSPVAAVLDHLPQLTGLIRIP
eukprot:456040_1